MRVARPDGSSTPTTRSTLLALPIWETASAGFPWLNATGSFLIKDVALLGESLARLRANGQAA